MSPYRKPPSVFLNSDVCVADVMHQVKPWDETNPRLQPMTPGLALESIPDLHIARTWTLEAAHKVKSYTGAPAPRERTLLFGSIASQRWESYMRSRSSTGLWGLPPRWGKITITWDTERGESEWESNESGRIKENLDFAGESIDFCFPPGLPMWASSIISLETKNSVHTQRDGWIEIEWEASERRNKKRKKRGNIE